MPKFVIEREIPAAGSLSAEELRGIARTSCDVLTAMGPKVQWLESYVTAHRVYSIFIAPNEQTVMEHATRGGFPANKITRVMRTMDPTTAE